MDKIKALEQYMVAVDKVKVFSREIKQLTEQLEVGNEVITSTYLSKLTIQEARILSYEIKRELEAVIREANLYAGACGQPMLGENTD